MFLQLRSLNAISWFLLEKGLDYKQLVEKNKIASTTYVNKFLDSAWQQVKLRIPLVFLLRNFKKPIFP
jgi:hypothetical protein